MRLLPLFLAALLLAAPSTACRAAEALTGTVLRIYDGDTLVVDGVGKVRLIGIDTPEKEASERDGYYRLRFGIPPERLRRIAEAARRFTAGQAGGKAVRLTFDGASADRHGRRLAYVTLPDGRLLNRLLLEEGLAAVYRRFDFLLRDDFLAAEEAARRRGVGLWKR